MRQFKINKVHTHYRRKKNSLYTAKYESTGERLKQDATEKCCKKINYNSVEYKDVANRTSITNVPDS